MATEQFFSWPAAETPYRGQFAEVKLSDLERRLGVIESSLQRIEQSIAALHAAVR